jgi:hypothetical protein
MNIQALLSTPKTSRIGEIPDSQDILISRVGFAIIALQVLNCSKNEGDGVTFLDVFRFAFGCCLLKA